MKSAILFPYTRGCHYRSIVTLREFVYRRKVRLGGKMVRRSQVALTQNTTQLDLVPVSRTPGLLNI